MDKRIRRNEICVIGLPRCDFVFSSARSCFIAYDFHKSVFETTIIKNILEKKKIEPVEAGETIAPGEMAFCTKICSKIITSQFCIVILDNEVKDGQAIPNANVNMEYGLILGFNKYVIPFQREDQNLPFNVSALDTVKYTQENFQQKATKAIEHAIEATRQDISPQAFGLDILMQFFLLQKKTLITSLDAPGDRDLYQLGHPLGFNLLNDFAGFNYIYFGNFVILQAKAIVWRLRTLNDILNGRYSSLEKRLQAGYITKEQERTIKKFFKKIQIWIVVNNGEEKRRIMPELKKHPLDYKAQIITFDDVRKELDKLNTTTETS